MNVSHPRFGQEIRVEQQGNEVHLILVAHTLEQAAIACDNMVRQLEAGRLTLTIQGRPNSITEKPE